MTGAKEITRALGGSWHGSYGIAFCPAHDNRRTPALSLADGANGRLLAHCHAGCAFDQIIDALRSRGILDGRWIAASSMSPTLPCAPARTGDAAGSRAVLAHRLWREARPSTGTLAERYLRGRGIDCPLPETLRFHPACRHPSGRDLPAMLALVEETADFAIHRTWLAEPDRKAKVEPSKAMFGPCRGGAVRLSAGAGPLVVAEGIETALSLLSGLLSGPAVVWAALSTSGLKGLVLPSETGRLVIAPDGDAPGRAAANALAERAVGLGWAVSLLPAPEGRDWNDVIRGRVAT